MALRIVERVLAEIHAHGENAYPEEGAGLLLGRIENGEKHVRRILKLNNTREDAARHNRYLLGPEDYLHGEKEAERVGMDVLGVFHSHPDHPNQPSEYDRQWAMPWFSYLITSVRTGEAAGSRSWLLSEDRTQFMEEELTVIPDHNPDSVLQNRG